MTLGSQGHPRYLMWVWILMLSLLVKALLEQVFYCPTLDEIMIVYPTPDTLRSRAGSLVFTGSCILVVSHGSTYIPGGGPKGLALLLPLDNRLRGSAVGQPQTR
jgi:hypothetical protein